MSLLLLLRSRAAAPAAPPVNVSPPTVTGVTVVAGLLQGQPGVWDQVVTYQYQWLRGGTPITGANAQNYTLTTADLGALISLQVTATGTGGSTVATSVQVGPVQAFIPPPAPGVSQVAPWTFVLCDWRGVAIGEPLATGRTITGGVSRTATASFQVVAGTRLWQQIQAGSVTLKVYNSTANLVFYGDLVSDELNADGSTKTVAVSAADLSFRLAHRFVGKSGAGDTYTSTDSGSIIFAELANANADFPTGIVAGLKNSFVERTVTFNWRSLSDVLSDLASIDGSYEWQLRYVDGTPPTVYLDLETQLGSDQTQDVFFEYGTGLNNCSGYQRVRSIETLATRVYALGQGSTVWAEAYDAGSEITRRFEDVVSVPDISSTDMLDSLAAAHVGVRHNPRQTVTVTPFPESAPRFGVDWYMGDQVTLRAVIDGVVDSDGDARVWGATINLDEFGNEAAVPVLEPQ